MSSRLCVKNLPKGADERRLREVFSRKGEVTDAKVIRAKDGKSRQFAFIGFRTNEEAEEALKYFNNTYIDTCKITCEVARKIGDPDAPRPWSRHSLKKPEYDSKSKPKAGPVDALLKDTQVQGMAADVRGSKGSVANDPKFQEFLEVMQPRSKAKMWANDTTGTLDTAVKDSVVATKESKRPQKNVPVSENDASSEDSSDEEMKIDSSSEDASEELQTAESKQDNDMTDTDFFKSKIKKNWSDSESDDEDSGDNSNGTTDDDNLSDESQDAYNQSVDLKGGLDKKINVDKDTRIQLTDSREVDDRDNKESEDLDGRQKETKVHEDKDNEDEDASSITDEKKLALETGRLFFCNLPYATTEDDLVELCSQYGDVEQAHIVVDKNTKFSTGRGYVLFNLPDSAVRALDELDNSSFQGRLLRVKAAKPLKNKKLESTHATVEVKMNLKQQKLEQKKASEISGDTRAWNSFYMRQDTVVENIARKNGISKSELLDREADDLAVRIALGETHVIAETKKYLSRSGVNVAALEELASKRNEKSKRSNHVILVKNLPFSTSEEELAAMFQRHGSLDKIVLPPTRVFALVVFVEATEARHAFKKLLYTRICLQSRSVFVKNLNFKTTDESLSQHFSTKIKSGSHKSVKVKKHVKNGKNVSMGFGFVEFDSVETATSVCKDLQAATPLPRFTALYAHIDVQHAKCPMCS
ncbi:hypothetical protein PVAP13_7KG345900 [Panicum virgatum]|uniref:RRM domain-containing protein n=1 Tax=Panicum virgatum TaxID=38727 RepID=A0A8T0QK04_PANVG|nr:hypothetical protein PVAP13_7KG345900 [Panicum virgatum]